MLESPLSYGRIVLHDWRAAALIHALSRPRPADASAEPIPLLSSAITNQLMTLLLNADMLTERNETEKFSGGRESFPPIMGIPRPAISQPQPYWQARFSCRGTYRFVGQIKSPLALKSSGAGGAVDLYRPDLEQRKREDPPFTLVHENRARFASTIENRSRFSSLASFYTVLEESHRARSLIYPRLAVQLRWNLHFVLIPSGGALHELELYLAVRACENLEAGIYHYEAQTHRFESNFRTDGSVLRIPV